MRAFGRSGLGMSEPGGDRTGVGDAARSPSLRPSLRGPLARGALALAVLLGMGIGAGAGLLTGAAKANASDEPIVVYQGRLVNQRLVLGPRSNPTLVVQTPPLPVGTYLVTATVGAVIFANDQIVCGTIPDSQWPANDGIYGTAGNASSNPAGIYGTAPITDTWAITVDGDRIDVGCNAFNYGKGTYAGFASITALPVKDAVVETNGGGAAARLAGKGAVGKG